MKRQSKAFRLPVESATKLKGLSELLGQSETGIVERAIDRLYENREVELEIDTAERKKKLK